MSEHHTPEFEFIALVALISALVAMSIDTMLPAVGIMAHELGAAHENDRQLIVLGFFTGIMLGTPVFGPLSDSIGRKLSIYGGIAVYCVGALICLFAPGFTALIVGRVIQGFGAGAARIVTLAMVRDGFKGPAMARIMSFVMSVFMLVPIFAPSIGQLVLYVASWRVLFAGFIVAALVMATWLALRQEETLAPRNRLPFQLGKLWASAREVLSHPVALGYTLASGFVFGVFTAWLGTCQQIFAEQYKQGDKFALWFGALATTLAIAMLLNGRLVMRLGMRKLSRRAMLGYMAIWLVILLMCLASAGNPPLWLLAPFLALWFFSAGFTFGNFNAMSMEPMGHIAGMAAAVSGTISQAMGIVLGGFAGRFYDGTITPMAWFFVAFAVAAFLVTEWAERHRKPARG
ncbi:MAG: multidrug effflux MFS transporter [Alphaproteobacteria bacterium]|nr:multidrug effflux MFS transporter [Alphaproteobacteria bacterium]